MASIDTAATDRLYDEALVRSLVERQPAQRADIEAVLNAADEAMRASLPDARDAVCVLADTDTRWVALAPTYYIDEARAVMNRAGDRLAPTMDVQLVQQVIYDAQHAVFDTPEIRSLTGLTTDRDVSAALSSQYPRVATNRPSDR